MYVEFECLILKPHHTAAGESVRDVRTYAYPDSSNPAGFEHIETSNKITF